MKIDVATLFPEMIHSLANYGVIGRALQKNLFEMDTIQIRDFSTDKHKKVDDEIFGGGAGMLMTPGPICAAIDSVRQADSMVIYLSPQGQILTQELCKKLAQEEHLILLCGHYEGIDARITNHYMDMEISIGDYVLTGGELPAMVLIDAVVRLLDGVLGNEESAKTDSHYSTLLQYDVYTRPRDFRGLRVPEVLLSGNHQMINEWREQSALLNTKSKRPDLYQKHRDQDKNKVQETNN